MEPSDREDYSSYLKSYLTPAFGNVRVIDISKESLTVHLPVASSQGGSGVAGYDLLSNPDSRWQGSRSLSSNKAVRNAPARLISL
jgi:hypothetical protein